MKRQPERVVKNIELDQVVNVVSRLRCQTVECAHSNSALRVYAGDDRSRFDALDLKLEAQLPESDNIRKSALLICPGLHEATEGEFKCKRSFAAL